MKESGAIYLPKTFLPFKELSFNLNGSSSNNKGTKDGGRFLRLEKEFRIKAKIKMIYFVSSIRIFPSVELLDSCRINPSNWKASST